MEKSDERLQLITATVLEQAEHEARILRANADKEYAEALQRHTDQIIDRMYGKIQSSTSSIRRENARLRADARSKRHSALLMRRRQLAASIFQVVRGRLEAYAATPQYREELLAKLRELAPQYDHGSSLVTLHPRDEALIPQIKEILGKDCAVQCENTVKLGGFTLKNTAAGVLVDCTLEEALDSRRSWFLEHCTMQVV